MTGPATDAPPGTNLAPPPAGGGGPAGARSNPPPTHVSESAYEFLLGEILHWVEMECSVDRLQAQQQQAQQAQQQAQQQQQAGTSGGGDESNPADAPDGGDDPAAAASGPPDAQQQQQPQPPGPSREELAILSAERAAAKIERLGFDVGYRLCERLAQSKPLGPGLPPPGPGTPKQPDGAVDPSSMQLEAVKFLCKEFWTEVFRKQIDKLQTNHRGVFVLKDHELRWLRRLPPEDETARVAAIKMLAFPCGLIRGALSNLGIAAVVSCDFLADGKNMAACSFNIKIKT